MKRLLHAIPLLFVMILALVGTAAAQPSWLPAYSPTQQIYVAPGVDPALAQSFSGRDFMSDIQRKAQVHNLHVIVVVTASGDDAGNDARQAGPALVRKLWDTWSKTSGFPVQRSIIILMTGDGHAITSVGVRAGEYLNGLGIQRNTMNDRNGPVIPVLRSYLASDPASVPGRIVANINTIVTAKLTPPANTGSGTTEGDSSMSIGTILLIVGGILIALSLFIRATRPRNPTSSPHYHPRARTTDLRKPSSGFESRIRNGRSAPAGRSADDEARRRNADDETRRRNDDTTNTAAALGAGVVGGMILNETLRRNDDERRNDSGSTDSGYVAPVATPSCSTPSSSPSCSSSSSSSGSSCSSGGSSCGGGGGGGCGGGGS